MQTFVILATPGSNMNLNKSLLLCLSVVSAAGCVVDVSGYAEREEKRFTLTGKADVLLTTDDGSIEVRSWDRQEVLVIVEKRSNSREAMAGIQVRAEQNGNRLTVDVKMPTGPGFGWDSSATLIVSLPAASDVRARSDDGSIDIEGIGGAVDLTTGDGSIRGRFLSGVVKAHTGDGSIDLDEVDGVLDMETGDGSIRARGKLTGVRAHTGDGGVGIRVEPGGSTATEWDIETGDGSVTIEVSDSFGAEIDARTGDGSIVIDDVRLSNVLEAPEKDELNGRLGAGGRPVRIRTHDGSITIRGF